MLAQYCFGRIVQISTSEAPLPVPSLRRVGSGTTVTSVFVPAGVSGLGPWLQTLIQIGAAVDLIGYIDIRREAGYKAIDEAMLATVGGPLIAQPLDSLK